jgi:hypothetical protein
VCESLRRTLQPLQIPERIARRPEENLPHIVVHADNFMPLPVEMFGRLRTDQAAATGDKYFHSLESTPLTTVRESSIKQ